MSQDAQQTFEAWARARQQLLLRWAWYLTGDYHRAEDLVQEALVRAADRWDSLRDGNPDALRARPGDSVPDQHLVVAADPPRAADGGASRRGA